MAENDSATFKTYSSEEKEDGKLLNSFRLDDKSVEFLESKLEAKINPDIETQKDYFRTVFYFKCCGIQKETDKPDSQSEKFSPQDCIFSKEKADLLFEDIYKFSLESDKFIKDLSAKMDAGNMPSEEEMNTFMDYQTKNQEARLLIMNDSLYSELEHKENNAQNFVDEQIKNNENYVFKNTYDYSLSSEAINTGILRSDDASFYQAAQNETISGNIGILRTASLQNLFNYIQSSPDLAQKMEKNYSAVVSQAAADIVTYLPKGANLDEYLPIIKEHPKAVLALAVTAKANNETNTPTTIASPEDLLKKSQYPVIVALSDKISFSDLQGSMKIIHQEAQPIIGLGRENTNTPTIHRAKVNEG
ncbi:MAG: hypothetical protein IJ218_06390 [Alphaproteobacteria bacterium]|nr:hypothetical protein [Alphaproteobacteria bacterium]